MRRMLIALLASFLFASSTRSSQGAASQSVGAFLREELRVQTHARGEMLAALDPSQRRTIAQNVGAYVTSSDPDFHATASRIDDILSPAQRRRILAIESNRMNDSASKMRAAFPKSRAATLTPERIAALMRDSQAGEWLLVTLMTATLGTNLPLTRMEFQRIGEGFTQLPGCAQAK